MAGSGGSKLVMFVPPAAHSHELSSGDQDLRHDACSQGMTEARGILSGPLHFAF
jgi:hypothetical protein